jgi:hypothetical protein
MRPTILAFACVVFSFATGHAQDLVTLLHDDFTAYPAGAFSSEVGAHLEYHYLPEAAAKGNWAVSTFRSSIPNQRAWRIVEVDGKRAMHQAYKNSFGHCHPMLVTGDIAWGDYNVTVEMAPETTEKIAGVAFRYQNDRCHYFAGVKDGNAILMRANHEVAVHKLDETILAEAPLKREAGDTVTIAISVVGSALNATINGIDLGATDDLYKTGKVAILSDNPTLFYSVDVQSTEQESARIREAIAARYAEEKTLQDANPQLELVKKIDLKDFGMARSIRFGDLDGDGHNDFILGQVEHHGPKDRNSELSCMTALNFEGKKLWQVGEADPWKNNLTSDVAFQIHDLDGDGKNEVIYVMNMELIVADGATGETKYKVATPETPANTKAEHAKFPRVLGDSIYFCDLRGVGRDTDIVLKDRYLSFWVFNDKLELQWKAQCNTGHYPYAYDVDGDGKDELQMGYTLFNSDGSVRWTLEDKITDHADGVAILPFQPGGEPRLLCAASDEGIFFADMKGNITEHYFLGHVQNPAIADFRPDLPGLEAVAINFWGNQGIVNYFDANNQRYHEFEPAQHGSMCLPINWTGEPGEFWILSANVEEGGMYDGWGRRVVRFPADGHPDMCNAVLNIMGDEREEVVVWDPAELWVYTQSDSPKELAFVSDKNPLYNYSNYQTTVSTPRE